MSLRHSLKISEQSLRKTGHLHSVVPTPQKVRVMKISPEKACMNFIILFTNGKLKGINRCGTLYL